MLKYNLANLFTKSLLTLTFNKLIYKIRIRQLKDIGMRVCLGHDASILYYFSICLGFIPLGFTIKVFNEALLTD